MITCSLRGQLANQMFIAATTIAHALRMNTTYTFPERSGKRDQFPFMFPELLGQSDKRGLILERYREPRFGIYEPLPMRDHLWLQGYFQSEKYFKEYKKEIIELFNIPVFETKKDVVSLHIRRGDSLKFVDKLPQPTDKYLNESLEYFPNHQVLVFSDDIAWCKEKFKGERFEFVEGGGDPKKTLGRMSSCQPIGTKVKTLWGDKNIEDLMVGESIVSYSHTRALRHNGVTKLIGRHSDIISNPDTIKYTSPIIPRKIGHPYGRIINRIEKRDFVGDLVRIDTCNGSTKYTPDHRCIVKLGDAFKDKYLVYLMRKGNKFRVGMTAPQSYFGGRKNKNLVIGYADVRNRFNSSKADSCWILSVKDRKSVV